MTTTWTAIPCFFVLLFLPLCAGAQDSPPAPPPGGGSPQQAPGGGPPPPQDRGGPPPARDAIFFQSQVMRAIDEKVSLLAEQGKTDAAIAELRKVQSIEVPKYSPAFEMKVRLLGRLAEAYARAGKKAEAQATIQSILAEVPAGSPAEAAAWLDAGQVYRSLGMADEALKAFDRAIELSKKLAQTGWNPPRPPGEGPKRPPKGRRP